MTHLLPICACQPPTTILCNESLVFIVGPAENFPTTSTQIQFSPSFPTTHSISAMDIEDRSCNFYQHAATLNLPLTVQVAVIQDNATSLPSCMSKTMRRYLLEAFPDLANRTEDARWKSQPSSTSPDKIAKTQSMRNIMPVVPQRQDSFTQARSLRNLLPVAPQRQESFTISSCSSASTVSSSSSPAPPSINRRKFLARQESSLLQRQDSSLLVRQSSLRRMRGAGVPRMPKRQDSATFLF